MNKNYSKIFSLLLTTALICTPVVASALDLSGIETPESAQSDFIHDSDVNALGSIQNIICSGLSPAQMADCMADLQDSNITAPQGSNPEASSNPTTVSSGNSGSSSGGSSSSGGGSSSSSGSTSSGSTSGSSSSTPTSTPAPVATPAVTSTEVIPTETPTTEVVETAAPEVQPTAAPVIPAVSTSPVVIAASTPTEAPASTKTTKKSLKITTAPVVDEEKLAPVALEIPAVQATESKNYQANLLLAIPVAKASQAPAILTSLFLLFLGIQGAAYAFYLVKNRR